MGFDGGDADGAGNDIVHVVGLTFLDLVLGRIPVPSIVLDAPGAVMI